jgi:uncharacterized protein (TIGR03086 family)
VLWERDWTARRWELQHRVARLVRGASRDEYVATREDDWIGLDHIAAWQEGVRVLDEAITDLGSLDLLVAYRIPISARDVIGLSAFDTAVHTWDVSRAIGFDERLDGGLVEFALDFIEWVRTEPLLEALFESPNDDLPDGASAQVRLLHLAGRQP